MFNVGNKKKGSVATAKVGGEMPFAISEAYKTVRTNLLFSLASIGKKTVVVSSALPQEGKSVTTANLAIALAQTSAKVMLIDGDLRRPTQHKLFGVDNTKGLSNMLAGFDSVADSVKRNVYANLDLITAGALPPNPSELLGSKNMEVFLQKTEEYYDYILIDSPPINIVTDAVVVSKRAAGIVLIARSQQTTIDELNSAVSSVKVADGNILGVVVSDVDRSVKASYYGHSKNRRYYYYNDYGKPYRERKQKADVTETQSGDSAE
ncbi:MAG: CpsD/CapB family tyrosine-protein kinase [Ruminococcaceae bacterium]|nr:CpsD/CapB family tyrosine-protein kinase [Oscillospiraceae bacterium]